MGRRDTCTRPAAMVLTSRPADQTVNRDFEPHAVDYWKMKGSPDTPKFLLRIFARSQGDDNYEDTGRKFVSGP